MVSLRFLIDKAKIEAIPEEDWETIEGIQDGEPPRLRKLRPLIANFMVDESNQPLPTDAAKKVLGKIPIGEWGEVTRQFVEALTGTAVPNATGSASNSLSEVSSAAPSLDGSTS